LSSTLKSQPRIIWFLLAIKGYLAPMIVGKLHHLVIVSLFLVSLLFKSKAPNWLWKTLTICIFLQEFCVMFFFVWAKSAVKLYKFITIDKHPRSNSCVVVVTATSIDCHFYWYLCYCAFYFQIILPSTIYVIVILLHNLLKIGVVCNYGSGSRL